MTELELVEYLISDPDMMAILSIIESLGLKDSWLAAGVVRNYIWNVVSGHSGFDKTTDIDVVFFDPNMTYEQTLVIQEQLLSQYPKYQWEVKNQCDMHTHSPDTAPYQSARDAISKYPETCTAVALRLSCGHLEVFAPYGIEVISSFIISPTPHFQASNARMKVYRERMAKKGWVEKWPQLNVLGL